MEWHQWNVTDRPFTKQYIYLPVLQNSNGLLSTNNPVLKAYLRVLVFSADVMVVPASSRLERGLKVRLATPAVAFSNSFLKRSSLSILL